jgi:hypothetical protein
MSILSGNPAKKNIFNPIKNSGGAQRPQWKILNTNLLFQTKNLGKETDVPANSERVRLQNSLSTLHQIKGESEILCALYFLSVKHANSTFLDTKQVRSAGIFFCKFTAPRCRK